MNKPCFAQRLGANPDLLLDELYDLSHDDTARDSCRFDALMHALETALSGRVREWREALEALATCDRCGEVDDSVSDEDSERLCAHCRWTRNNPTCCPEAGCGAPKDAYAALCHECTRRQLGE
jgi:hypothetical protein